MRKARMLNVAVLVLLVAQCAAAQTVDLSSPKAAVASLYQAVDRADEQAIKLVFHTETDPERELADAYAKLILATRQLADAAKEKFGGGPDAFAQGAFAMGNKAQLDSAQVRHESEDAASIQFRGSTRPLLLRRSGGNWRIVMSEFAGASSERVASQITLLHEMTSAMSETAVAIAEGKYATVQDAESAIQQRMSDVMMRAVRTNSPATTRAATTKSAD